VIGVAFAVVQHAQPYALFADVPLVDERGRGRRRRFRNDQQNFLGHKVLHLNRTARQELTSGAACEVITNLAALGSPVP
jgi:hypothetical protein